MKRLTYLLLFVLVASMTYAQQAKYVFFFICPAGQVCILLYR